MVSKVFNSLSRNSFISLRCQESKSNHYNKLYATHIISKVLSKLHLHVLLNNKTSNINNQQSALIQGKIQPPTVP